MDKTGAVHRFDRRLHGLSETSEPSGKAAKTVGVRWRGASLDRPARLIEQTEIETLATEIQSRVQHCVGPPFVFRGRAEHYSAGGPSSSHSFGLVQRRTPVGPLGRHVGLRPHTTPLGSTL